MVFEDKFLFLVNYIKEAGIASVSFDEALSYGCMYGNILWSNHADIYRDDDFEVKLIEQYLAESKVDLVLKEKVTSGELHIISMPFSTGGHTRLLEKIIKIRGKGDILITRPISSIEGILDVNFCENIIFSESGFNLNDIVRMISNYKTIYMHIHPDDLVACVAVGVVKSINNTRVIFVNHADHVFSFGFYCSDIVAEVSEYGFYLNKIKRFTCSSFLGIPVNLNDVGSCFKRTGKEGFSIFSAGSGIKYKPDDQNSFPALAKKILKNNPAALITVVGPKLLTDWWWWLVKARYPVRLRIYNTKPYDEYISFLRNADLYIDSFPMTGGTALPEIRGLNIPVTGVLSGSFGYTPLDSIKYKDVSELASEVHGFIDGVGDILSRNNSDEILHSMKYAHATSSVKDRIDGIVDRDEISLPSSSTKSYDIDFYRKSWSLHRTVKVSAYFMHILINDRSFEGGKKLRIILKLIDFKNFHSVVYRYLVSRFFSRYYR